ncbi:MAG: Fur family transcriptional regulator [Anaerolineae bacterium]
MHERLDYLDQIRRRGYRVTPQRQLILDTLCQMGGHATPSELFRQVQPQMPSLNQATVYRVLDFLCDMNLVAKTEWGGSRVYEIIGHVPHHHLVCRRCGYTEILDDAHLQDLSDHLQQQHGFKAEINHLAITGLCAQCLKSGGNR